MRVAKRDERLGCVELNTSHGSSAPTRGLAKGVLGQRVNVDFYFPIPQDKIVKKKATDSNRPTMTSTSVAYSLCSTSFSYQSWTQQTSACSSLAISAEETNST